MADRAETYTHGHPALDRGLDVYCVVAESNGYGRPDQQSARRKD